MRMILNFILEGRNEINQTHWTVAERYTILAHINSAPGLDVTLST